MPIALERDLLKRRRTKIIATVGPSSATPAVLAELVRAGVNVFRLNMSHGDHAGHRSVYTAIREAAHVGQSIGLAVHAGHGLTVRNVGPVAAVPEIEELNIGHSIVSRSIT